MPRSKVAVITGAASGIGRAVAERMVREGYEVLAVDLRPDPHGPGTPHEADLTDADANAAVVAAALERFGGLDVIVAGAGIQHVAPIAEFP
ncbi:MAG TPA: SDR family NAD(P)-dependent oxidoreductase, partial [Solirubrobacteraceae bacterium]|nr:SDR family NAD(P)-dependent oxidoreductase [Solirubrobacteraceae bacterium]